MPNPSLAIVSSAINEYTTEFLHLVGRNHLDKAKGQQISRFTDGLKPTIRDRVIAHCISNLTEVMNRALQAEWPLQEMSLKRLIEVAIRDGRSIQYQEEAPKQMATDEEDGCRRNPLRWLLDRTIRMPNSFLQLFQVQSARSSSPLKWLSIEEALGLRRMRSVRWGFGQWQYQRPQRIWRGRCVPWCRMEGHANTNMRRFLVNEQTILNLVYNQL